MTEVRQFVQPSYHFDQDLRDVPDNMDEWTSFFENLKSQLKEEVHPENRLHLIEYIGMTARTLLKFEEAETFLLKAVSLTYDSPKHGRLIQNLIRLAHVYQWKKDFEKSHLLFDQARALMNERPVSDSLRAAYHQHLGKLYFDQQLYGLAQAEFGLALKIRKGIPAPMDQLQSSEASYNEAVSRWNTKVFEGVILRRAQVEDAEALHNSHMRSIRELCQNEHTPEEIKAWGGRAFDAEARTSNIKSDFVLAVEYRNKIEGYGLLKVHHEGSKKWVHIYGLYITPTVHKKGVGQALMNIMTEKAKLEKVNLLTLKSSLTAFEFYKRNGFVPRSLDEKGQPVVTVVARIQTRGIDMRKKNKDDI